MKPDRVNTRDSTCEKLKKKIWKRVSKLRRTSGDSESTWTRHWSGSIRPTNRRTARLTRYRRRRQLHHYLEICSRFIYSTAWTGSNILFRCDAACRWTGRGGRVGRVVVDAEKSSRSYWRCFRFILVTWSDQTCLLWHRSLRFHLGCRIG